MASTSGISFTGLFSNLDTDSIVTQLMTIERQPVKLLETKQTKLNLQKTELQTVNSALLALKNALKALVSSGSVFNNTVKSADESIVTGSATSASSAGDHTVEVQQLARENIIASGTKASTYTWAGGDQAFYMKSGDGKLFQVNVSNGFTLANVTAAINNATSVGGDKFSDYGTAYLVTDPATGNQTVIVKAKQTGTANKIDVQVIPGNNVATQLGFRVALPTPHTNEIQTAQNAVAVVNGITVSSPTNVLEKALSGVTLNLLKADPGNPVKITIGMNEDDLVSKVRAFVEQFNKTTDMLSGYIGEKPISGAKTETDMKKGILFGDSDLIRVKGDIRLMTTGYSSSDPAQTVYKILAQLGIQSEQSLGSLVSSKLELDEDKLRTALANDREQAVGLINSWAEQLDRYLESQTKVSVVESFAGNFYRRMISIDKRVDQIDKDIDKWEVRLASMEERLRNQYASMEQALQKMQTQSSYLTNQLNNLLNSANSNK